MGATGSGTFIVEQIRPSKYAESAFGFSNADAAEFWVLTHEASH